jgi:hypothetical protein
MRRQAIQIAECMNVFSHLLSQVKSKYPSKIFMPVGQIKKIKNGIIILMARVLIRLIMEHARWTANVSP